MYFFKILDSSAFLKNLLLSSFYPPFLLGWQLLHLWAVKMPAPGQLILYSSYFAIF